MLDEVADGESSALYFFKLLLENAAFAPTVRRVEFKCARDIFLTLTLEVRVREGC